MRWVVVVLLSGCSSILGIDDFKLGDAGSSGAESGNEYCLGPTGWLVCVASEPTEIKTPIDALSFNTTDSSLCLTAQPAAWKAAGQPDACFIVAKQITFGSAVKVSGGRPLVVLASDSITITGQIDAASHSGSAPSNGPGASATTCLAPTHPGGSANGGGGAAGGSFMTKGGDGGLATSPTGTRGIAAAPDTQPPILLRGGCDGDTGGVGSEAGGAAGKGGGAVYLLAGGRITINGFINVSGSAGRGSGRLAGGGGGGSGGMIVLHAPMIAGTGGVLRRTSRRAARVVEARVASVATASQGPRKRGSARTARRVRVAVAAVAAAVRATSV